MGEKSWTKDGELLKESELIESWYDHKIIDEKIKETSFALAEWLKRKEEIKK